MIDFHSHILPAFDDGAEDVAMSVKMLKRAYESGIDTVVATSHAYIINDGSIAEFLEKRGRAYEVLCEAMKEDGGKFPKILLGAEVHIKSYLTELNMINELTIEGTDYILIEMPYSAWQQEHYESVYNCTISGLKPIIAHADRYLDREEKFRHLKAFGAIFQINADSVLSKALRKKILNLFYNGYAHIIGSDMHNCTTRPNRIKDACEYIFDTFGVEFIEYISRNSEDVLKNENVFDSKLPSIPLFKRIML